MMIHQPCLPKPRPLAVVLLSKQDLGQLPVGALRRDNGQMVKAGAVGPEKFGIGAALVLGRDKLQLNNKWGAIQLEWEILFSAIYASPGKTVQRIATINIPIVVLHTVVKKTYL